MTISKLKKHFSEQLSEIYSEREVSTLFYLFAEEKFGFNKINLIRKFHEEILLEDEEIFEEIIVQLKSGKPFQQILGFTEFFGLRFFVNENVLIPRPETEELVEIAISEIKNSKFKITDLRIIDIGTGSGIIPITLKKYFPEAEIFAIDISEKALEIAKQNAKFHQAEINFIQQDYLNADLEGTFDVVISNPPYIATNEEAEIEHSVKDFEPKIALFSPTQDALVFYKKIAKDCENHLQESGIFFLEINQKLGKETLELFHNFTEKNLMKDLSGNERFVIGRK